jgi:tetratricopeptide (TPR) repeat protein
MREYRRAIDLDPNLALPHSALAQALFQTGRFAEARDANRRCLELLPPADPLRQPVARQLQQCEQSLGLEQKLAAVLRGKEKPANDGERLALAWFCQQSYEQRYAAAYRFYAEAFVRDAKLADDMPEQHRYNAACAAALAGCGQGKDAGQLDAKERARLREQAITWLRADLTHWAKQARSDKRADRALVQETLRHWQVDADLAGIRTREAIQRLPADERQVCAKLWADVAELLRKVQEQRSNRPGGSAVPGPRRNVPAPMRPG